jgi:hypothetical protein
LDFYRYIVYYFVFMTGQGHNCVPVFLVRRAWHRTAEEVHNVNKPAQKQMEQQEALPSIEGLNRAARQ